MNIEYDIQIDFKKDFENILKNELELCDYNTSKINDMCFSYFNLINRLILPKPRKVLQSREFNCPNELKNSLNILKKKIEKGDNINQYLSKKILDLEYNDPLLNDWGIHHMHLGDLHEKEKFVNRTGPLLFVFFNEEYAYFINTYKHGAWTNDKLIRILYENWEESIKNSRIDGVDGLENNITDDIRKELRKNNIVTFTEVGKGIVYLPIGGGYMADGSSTYVRRVCLTVSKKINYYENFIYDIKEDIVNEMKEKGSNLSKKIIFNLFINKNEAFAYEQHSNKIIKFGYFHHIEKLKGLLNS